MKIIKFIGVLMLVVLATITILCLVGYGAYLLNINSGYGQLL